MELSKIAWTDNTFNPWIGCTRVSAGCEHCYAEAQNRLRTWNGGTWGPGAPRKVTSDENWRKPLAWDKKAREEGKRTKVFCASLSDVFDHEAPIEARQRLWELIRQTPNLDWLILTKRPQNFKKYLPEDWGTGYLNVWLGVTCENRKQGFPRVDILRETPAKVRFLSCEPLLESVKDANLTGIDWVIVGGESGAGSREFDVEWGRELQARCLEEGVKFFVKQLGSHPTAEGTKFPILLRSLGGKKDVHGANPENFPTDLRTQTWPESSALTKISAIPGKMTAGQKAAATRKRNATLTNATPATSTWQDLSTLFTSVASRFVDPQNCDVPPASYQEVVLWLKFHVNSRSSAAGHIALAAISSLNALTEILSSPANE